MTATNHALTGAAIGLFVPDPVIAMPLAFMSHFVLDSIPHYDAADKVKRMKSRKFKVYLLTEASICFLIVLALAVMQPVHWWSAAICAFLAASPDFYWIRRWRATVKNKRYQENWFGYFCSKIQWFQRPIGWVVEVAWFIAMLTIIIPVFKLLAKS